MGRESPYSFRHAVSLATATGAKIVVLHVLENTSTAGEVLNEPYNGPKAFGHIPEKEAERAADRLCRRIAANCEAQDSDECASLVSRVIIGRGHPAEQVLNYAREVEADLIIIGAKAETGELDEALGRTAATVVGHCMVPVITVRTPEDYYEPGVSDI